MKKIVGDRKHSDTRLIRRHWQAKTLDHQATIDAAFSAFHEFVPVHASAQIISAGPASEITMNTLSPGPAVSDWPATLFAELAIGLGLDIQPAGAAALTLLDEEQVEWTIEASPALDQVAIHSLLLRPADCNDPDLLRTWLGWNARTTLMRGACVAWHPATRCLRLLHTSQTVHTGAVQILDRLSHLMPLRRHLISAT